MGGVEVSAPKNYTVREMMKGVSQEELNNELAKYDWMPPKRALMIARDNIARRRFAERIFQARLALSNYEKTK